MTSRQLSGRAARLDVLRRLKSFRLDHNAVELTVDAAVMVPGRMKASYLEQGERLDHTGAWTTLTVRIDLLGDRVFRYRVDPAGLRSADSTLLSIDDLDDVEARTAEMRGDRADARLTFSVEEDDRSLYFRSEQLWIAVDREPFSLRLLRPDGSEKCSQYNDDLHGVVEDRRARARREDDDDSLSFPLPRILPCCRLVDADGSVFFVESLTIQPGEHFYGFGERFSPLDKLGTAVLNRTQNPVGVSTNEAYKPVPFFHSTNGYAAYYRSARSVEFHMGVDSYKAYTGIVPGDRLDIVYFCHDDPKENLSAFSALAGRADLPPPWSFGVWMSRNCYASQAEIGDVAAELRERKLPCDVLHLDWNYGVDMEFSFSFDRERFPDMASLAAKLYDDGFQLSIWQLPYVQKDSALARELADTDYLVWDGAEAVIDFSNPGAVAWYQEKIEALLLQGFRAVKTDFGEAAPETDGYAAADGREMHNLYPFFYAKAAYESCRKIHPDDAVIWGRSAYVGGQRFPLYWGGDADSDYAGMYHSLRGGLSLGLSGFPFWSHDVGGYFGRPDDDVYIRWLQFGMLSPFVRFHGTTAREPWHFGDEAVRIYRKYARLRYALAAYLYSEAAACTADGTPLLRALWLDSPDDRNTLHIDDQYLLGRSLLVAPVFSTHPARDVYLPSGRSWYEAETDRLFAGGQSIRADAPLDTIPVYIRGGSAIPVLAPAESIRALDVATLHWELYPGDRDEIGYRYTAPRPGAVERTFRAVFDRVKSSLALTYDGGGLPVSCRVRDRDRSAAVRRVTVNGLDVERVLDEDGFLVTGPAARSLFGGEH